MKNPKEAKMKTIKNSNMPRFVKLPKGNDISYNREVMLVKAYDIFGNKENEASYITVGFEGYYHETWEHLKEMKFEIPSEEEVNCMIQTMLEIYRATKPARNVLNAIKDALKK